LTPDDRDGVEAMTRGTGLFSDAEIAVALEVFDDGFVDPDYESAGVEVDGTLAGWACWGPTPNHPGTFDLYWIVVSRARQGLGLGALLLGEMGRRIAGRARTVLVETSGRPDYAPTRAFYERHGYRQVGLEAGHYGPGDDLVRYAKELT
jgi:ribosomal protein S18 acetylase RimI-like enzyme